jgi:general secretion pathway protein J
MLKILKKSSGFTLLEILLAVFIFALITTGAYQIFSLAQKNAVSIQASQDRLHDISLTLELIEKDLSQLVSRAWRDPYSDKLNPPLQSNPADDYILRLVRGGWRNPLGSARSNQQLVTYRLVDGELQRHYHQHLDNVSSSQANELILLNKVNLMELTFIDRQTGGQANTNSGPVSQWPPLSSGMQPRISSSGNLIKQINYPMPVAIEITLELEDLGKISKIIPLASGA